jgi:hypothetical protein
VVQAGKIVSTKPRAYTKSEVDELVKSARTETFDQFWDAAAAFGVPTYQYTPGALVLAIAKTAEERTDESAAVNAAAAMRESDIKAQCSHCATGNVPFLYDEDTYIANFGNVSKGDGVHFAVWGPEARCRAAAIRANPLPAEYEDALKRAEVNAAAAMRESIAKWCESVGLDKKAHGLCSFIANAVRALPLPTELADYVTVKINANQRELWAFVARKLGVQYDENFIFENELADYVARQLLEEAKCIAELTKRAEASRRRG